MIHAYQAEDLNNDMNSVEIKASDLKLGNYVPLFTELDEDNGIAADNGLLVYENIQRAAD